MSGTINGLIQKVEHFGFAELQGLMEAEAGDIASRQEDSERSRKSLIELTMQFRQETPEESRRLAVPVLKRYQTEMDQLCERSKAAENAYLSIYTKLITLPDIPALLEYCRTAQQKLSQLADLQTENSELKTTLNDSNRELQHVRHQDVIIKQLKEEVKKYETSQTETVEMLVQQAEQRLLRQFEEREHVLQDEQLLLSRQLTEAQLKSAQLSSDLDLSQNQLMELKTKFDEITGARSDEYDLLTDELARSDERAAMAEREVNSLKEQLAASHKSAADDPQLAGDEVNSGHRTVDLELAAKEKEISHLIEDVGRLQCRLTSLESQSISQRTQLEEQLAQRNKIICRLEHVLDRQKDYNEVKKELEIMKSIEFPGVSQRQSSGDRSLDERESEQEEGEEEGVGGSREGDEDRGERGESDATTLHRAAFDRPLEMLLMEKNRRLQHTNTTLKNSNAALQARVETADAECQQLINQLQQQKELVQQLEADLGNVHSFTTMAERGSYSSSEWMAEAVRGTFPVSSAEKELAHSPPPTSTTGDSLLPIVTAQRERFRARINELEENLLRQSREVVLKDSELEDLRTDNLKLYEKIKYLQSYSTQQRTVHQDVDTRYSQQYEAELDPFSSFARRERRRKYMQMNAFEKIMHSMAQMMVSSRGARLVAMGYAFLLHFLVFVVLYKLAYSEALERDLNADCAMRYAEHMVKAHGKKNGSGIRSHNH